MVQTEPTTNHAGPNSPLTTGSEPSAPGATGYTTMGAGDMIQALGNDSMKWAEAFCEKFPAVPVDEAFGWFANAMMTMWDVTNSDATHSDEALVDHISALVRNRDLWRELTLGNAPLNDGGSSPSTHEATSSNGLTPDLPNEGSETNSLSPNQEQP